MRNISIDLWRKHGAKKRGNGLDAMLSELEECIPALTSTEDIIDAKELTEIINRWLSMLSQIERRIFVRRYWHGEDLATIAKREKMTSKELAGKLYRLRQGLKNRLTREGVTL